MMRGPLLLLMLLLPAMPAPVEGQEPLTEKPPLPYQAVLVDEWDKGDESMPVAKWREITVDLRYRGIVETVFAEDLAAGRWLSVFDRLANDCRGATWSDKADIQARFQRRLDHLVQVFGSAVEAADLDGPADTAKEISLIAGHLQTEKVGAVDFTVERMIDDEAPDDGGGDFFVARLFGGTGDEIVFTRGASGHKVDGTVVTMHQPLLDTEQILDLRLRTDTIRYLLTKFLEPLRHENVEAIHNAHLQWRNYLFEGYSQYPWEAAANGAWLDFTEMKPPRRQWIIGHPSVAIEAEIPSPHDMHVEEALVIEGIGHLFYRGDDLSDYRGASIILCLRDEERTGFGALLHLKRGLRLGLVWRDVNHDKKIFNDNPSLIFSVDLYRHIQKHGGRLAETWRKVADKVENE